MAYGIGLIYFPAGIIALGIALAVLGIAFGGDEE